MNQIDLKWPEGATDGALICPEHDEYWLDKTFEHTLKQ